MSGEDIRSRFKRTGPSLPRTNYALPRSTPPQRTFDLKPDAVDGQKIHKKHKYSFRLPKSKKVLISIGGLAVLFAVILFAYISYRPQHTPPSSSSHAALGTTIKPAFTIFYPSKIPAGLIIDKASIQYSKDSFVFNLKQGSEDRFFVSEQPAGSNFDFSTFKSKLESPLDVKMSLGQGVVGGLNGGLITAVKPKENTLIIIHCVNTICGAPSKELLENLKIVSDVTKL